MIVLEAEEGRGLAEEKRGGSLGEKPALQRVPKGVYTNDHPQKPHSAGNRTSRTKFILW